MKTYVSVPEQCALCSGEFNGVAFDAKHPQDRVWGWFCLECFKRMNGQLGVGRGQKYVYAGFTGRWEQVAGGRLSRAKA